jgi:hypothetical protein
MMSNTDQAHALIVQAALEVARSQGVSNLPVALPQPLEPAQRRYLYAVPDGHPLAEKYGSSKLFATLVETQTPHLVGQKPPHQGVRYTDRNQQLPPELKPFTSDEARRACRAEMLVRRAEQQEIRRITQSLTGRTYAEAHSLLPEPNSEQHLAASHTRSISHNTTNTARRSHSESR